MSRVPLSLALPALVVLLLTGCSSAQQPPSETQCRATFSTFSQNDLLIRLAPCQQGATSACCEAGQNLAGFRSNAPLPGCLCYKSALDELIANAESNALARTAGVNRALIVGILQQCGAPFFGGTGKSRCPDTTQVPLPAATAGDALPPSDQQPAVISAPDSAAEGSGAGASALLAGGAVGAGGSGHPLRGHPLLKGWAAKTHPNLYKALQG